MKERPLVYLAGAIAKAPDFGSEWRLEAEKKLRTFGFDTYNPLDGEKEIFGGISREEFYKMKQKAMERKHPSTFLNTGAATVLKKMVALDLKKLLESDYVLAYWDKYISGGTPGEITVAYYKKIPVVLVYNMGLSRVSEWVLGCSEAIYPNLVEGINHYRELARELGLRKHLPDSE